MKEKKTILEELDDFVIAKGKVKIKREKNKLYGYRVPVAIQVNKYHTTKKGKRGYDRARAKHEANNIIREEI